MTTYILTGGNDRATANYGSALATAVHLKHEGPIRVVSCLFAIPREDWEVDFSSKQLWFKDIFGADTTVTMAFPAAFELQASEADLIYIHGGDDALLDYYFSPIPNLVDIFRNKVVVGSSAGANFLSSSFWTCDWREARRGSGLTALNVIPHYESTSYGASDPRGPIDWTKAEAELRALAAPDGVVTPLREGELAIVEV